MKFQSKLLILMTSLMLVLTSFVPVTFAKELTAKEIAKKADNVDDGETSISEMTMVLVDRKKKEKKRQIQGYRKDYGEDKKSISIFMSPADIKNTSFLSYDWNDDAKEDDNWLYMPALRKVKRIASSNKKNSFMGSDFSYHDMNGLNISEWEFKFAKKKTAVIDGQECWVIDSQPRKDIRAQVIKDTDYKRRRAWIRKDNFMAVQVKILMKKRGRIKVLKVKDIKKIQNIWTAHHLEMTTYQNKKMYHRTILLFNNIVYNKGVDEKMFTTQWMQRGL